MTRSYDEILNAYIKEDIMKYIKCKELALLFRCKIHRFAFLFTECHSSVWTRDSTGVDFITLSVWNSTNLA